MADTSSKREARHTDVLDVEDLLDMIDNGDNAGSSSATTGGTAGTTRAGTTGDSVIHQTKVAGTSASFRDFMLRPELTKALQENAFEAPSIIQQEAIPQGIVGTDLLCQAQSGSGKTCVFVLSVLQQLEVEPGCVQCVCVAPTRELALQITEEFVRFSRNFDGVKVACFTGGHPEAANKALLESDPPNIIIGTPGRLEVLAEKSVMHLDHLKYFIVDECDVIMADERMKKSTHQIYSKCPARKQVMMFSATMNPDVLEECRKWLRKPKEIFIDDPSKQLLSGIVQRYITVTEAGKNPKLEEIFTNLSYNQLVIFVSSKERSEKLCLMLSANGYPSICIHSSLPQTVREERCREFRDGLKRILVTTDLFHRGMDIPAVNFVLNYDMPANETTYLHRIGRAGRFSTYGLAISFIATPEDEAVLEEIKKHFSTAIPELVDWSSDLEAFRTTKTV